ncbi:MAG: histidine phosphotransferase [Alphaproteobacteria bacterium]|nr:histidine phosphotransferase [Alphaproteobacteria bacterium]MBU6473637.1 histidine phosphotransferase [Alphaproteobacteria bacterium]MDE2013666.1 histidine phosphotransferase [Alphaproteobacteria bacterium]MDE2072710.1 histidine phosphotransferase [Alphaproteobacteria bacterium]
MNDIEFAALLVSRVCHDLVSPVSAVGNGLEVLADERDAGMRADALALVTSSAEQVAARLKFSRIAFGAAGAVGAELDLTEVCRLIDGVFLGTKMELAWQAPPLNWPKNWAKLLMNAALVVADSLPRGGRIAVETSEDPAAPRFTVRGTGLNARFREDSERAARGDDTGVESRSIQAFFTYKLARALNAGLTLTALDGAVEVAAG